jgi:hypothetical protein
VLTNVETRFILKFPFIIFLLFLFAGCASKKPNADSLKSGKDKLIPFDAVLISGDIVIRKYEINIYEKQDTFYADNISPGSYFNREEDSIWTIMLDESKILYSRKFLDKAKTLPAECPQVSSSIKDLTITFGKETLKIKGDCKWDSLDFFKWREILFKDFMQH